MSARLAHQTQKAVGIGNGMRTATITAVTTSGVTISVAGGSFSSGVGVVTSYAPRVGDTVAVFRQDSSWMILGTVTPSMTGVWVRLSTLGYQNGWSDRGPGYPYGQYRVVGNEVQLCGQITNAATPASGTIIAAGLPAPPGEACMLAAQGATTPGLHVDSGGNLRYYNGSTTGIMQFSVTYQLDFLA